MIFLNTWFRSNSNYLLLLLSTIYIMFWKLIFQTVKVRFYFTLLQTINISCNYKYGKYEYVYPQFLCNWFWFWLSLSLYLIIVWLEITLRLTYLIHYWFCYFIRMIAHGHVIFLNYEFIWSKNINNLKSLDLKIIHVFSSIACFNQNSILCYLN